MRKFASCEHLAPVLFAILLVFASPWLPNIQAQEAWDDPVNLFETDGRASEAEVVSDPYGIVHVFWAYAAPGDEESGASQSIYHSSYQDGEWSKPVDVLVSPGDRVARMHSVAADAQGNLHIVWSGGDALLYSRAYAPQAGSAQAWTIPHVLSSRVNVGEPAIAVDGQDRIYLVWSEAGNGLIFSRSEDGGDSWSAPKAIFEARQGDELARWGRVAVDEAGRLHVAFTHTVRLEDPPEEEREDPNYLYYLVSEDQGKTWSDPFLITPEPDFGEVNVATFGEDLVHLVWNGRAGRFGRYHRLSQDGGETWSNEVEILAPSPLSFIGTGGLTGFPALVSDLSGKLHMISATGGGDYYFQWQDGNWSEPVLVSPGLDGRGVTNEGTSLEQPSIVLNAGNQLHVVFHDGFERIWHTTKIIDTLELVPVTLPTRDSDLSAAAPIEPTFTPVQEEQPAAAYALNAQTTSPLNSSSNTSLLISMVPALLLIGIVTFLINLRRRR